MKLATAAEMRELDRQAIKDYGIPGMVLMENAAAAVTDVKGDRNLSPHEQTDKDMYLHMVDQTKEGIVVKGAKVHQTGSLSCHEVIVLPTRALH